LTVMLVSSQCQQEIVVRLMAAVARNACDD
jgi:hypothetical protein